MKNVKLLAICFGFHPEKSEDRMKQVVMTKVIIQMII